VSRVVNMVHKYFGGVLPDAGAETAAETALRESAGKTIAAFGPAFDELNFSEALRTLWALVAETDGYLTANAPWKKPADRSAEDHAKLQARVLATAAEAIRIITALVYPILPDSAAKAWKQLGQGEIGEAARNSFLTKIAWGGLKAGTQFGAPAPLFPRAEKDAVERMQNIEDQNSKSAVEAATCGGASSAAKIAPVAAKTIAPKTDAPAPAQTASATATPIVPAVAAPVAGQAAAAPAAAAPAQAVEEKQYIHIDDFAKVDLRVAQILVAERIPKADKLLRLEVDLGYEKRQILAGIAQYYEPEKLVGRKIVIVANLAPRKMRGLMSNGMLLAASLPDSSPVLAGFLEDVPLGSRLR
jgi:methionyl-tRNA synthetase